ncbi:AMP-binding protein [Pseudoalteromonas sp. MMG012]|uniref:AMP-binding protein n=1 Tax=Pseudoalteromonas sp. MMG012 TaxID=2822686 RepID=UPI001B3A61EF|nr:AMP-binding protein [Pseudoalteromonas sp. MMG012]MBQ4849254.1 AMP-dependent synthetase [Pseudoalteromonas sp. MMG012]
MQSVDTIITQLKVMLVSDLEVLPEQAANLSISQSLLETPVFLDSVDLMQLYAQCKKTFALSVISEPSFPSLEQLATAIIDSAKHQALPVQTGYFYDNQNTPLSEGSVLDLIALTAYSNIDIKPNNESGHVYVKDSSPLDIIKTVCVLLSLGYTPILSAAKHAPNNAFSWQQLPKTPSNINHNRHQLLPFLQMELIDNNVGFETSGSTGTPQQWFKSIRALLNEADTFTQSFDFSDVDYITACVDLRHMYGFVWGFALPLKLNIPVHYQHSNTPQLCPVKQQNNACIVTPTLWDFAAEQLCSKTKLLVSSGAAFGAQRTVKLEEIQKEKQLICPAIEVLGSTETGALGYRTLKTTSRYFTRFNVVNFKLADNGQYQITSPFLASGLTTFSLQDKLNFIDENTFEHLGRLDKIFKYAGKRVSIKAVEDVLSHVFSDLNNKVYFIEDTRNIKGGELVAFVESPKLSLTDFADFQHHFVDLPIPKINFIKSFPINDMGKTTLSALKEMIHD